MAYKLVCIDVDGTLLNSRHRVTERTKESILKAHRLGVHIVVSTGRMYTDAEYYSNLIGVKSPVIASNGAFIKEKDNDKVIYQKSLDEDLSLELLRLFRQHRIKPYFCTPHRFYYGNIMFKLFYWAAKIFGIRSNKLDAEYVFSWERWEKILQKEKGNIVKCEIIYKDASLIRKLRNKLECIEELEIVDSTKHNIEITSKGVSKGKAVEMLADLYNFKREEIMTIGDSENDLSMIEYAGLGVAMGNGADKVKKRADYITGSNDENGVASAIDKFILGDKH